MKKLSFPTSSLLLAAIFSSFVGCTKKDSSGGSNSVQASANEIVVGEYGSMTGSEATFGQSTSNGLKMAFEEKNKAGGVKGKQLKLITLDNRGLPEEAAAAVTRLINQNKVIAVVGEVASTRTLAAAPIAQRAKIPLITPASTNTKVTEVGDYIFRVCFIDPFQGTVMAKFAHENLKAKKVAVLRDQKSDYSMGLADAFITKFKELGGQIVADQSYSSGDADFMGQLTQIRGTNPDAIYVPGYYTEVSQIARQARANGIKVPLMGGDGWDSAKLSELGGTAINGSYFSNHYTTESSNELVKDFIKNYKARYNNQTPDALAALGYDAGKILIQALETAPELSPKAVRDQLANTKDFAGVTGQITIDANRNTTKSAVVVKVDGNVNRFVTTISP